MGTLGNERTNRTAEDDRLNDPEAPPIVHQKADDATDGSRNDTSRHNGDHQIELKRG